jgi:hypothetical protein
MTVAARLDCPYQAPEAYLCSEQAEVQIGRPSPANDASADPVQPLLRRTVARSLPLGWDATVTRSGQLYYFCTVGGKRVLRPGQYQWPEVQVQRTVARPLPLDWDARSDRLGRTCYINTAGKTQHNCPEKIQPERTQPAEEFQPEETQPGGDSGVFEDPGSPLVVIDSAPNALAPATCRPGRVSWSDLEETRTFS